MSYDVSFQTSVWPLLRDAIEAALATPFLNQVYWQLAPQDADYPLCVFQSQDAGGKRADTIGANGWEGLVTFRVMSPDPDEADTKLAAIPALLQGLSAGGYSLTVTPDRPLTVPPETTALGYLYTAAVICRCNLS